MSMKWKLKIRNFGKIKEAEIHNSSLRFIVGHNNSGKSYLMTLLWGIEKITNYTSEVPLSEQEIDLSSWISEEQYNRILNGEQFDLHLLDYIDIINCYINLILQKEKDKIVSRLFHFEDVKIEELSLWINPDKSETFMIYKSGMTNVFQLCVHERKQQMIVSDMDTASIESQRLSILHSFVCTLLDSIFIGHNRKDGKAIYLPAARTGFMLTKDIINKTSRRIAFANEENKFEPFTMPIIEFLDAMEAIDSSENSGNLYEEIINLIEDKMLQGKLYVNDNPNKALRFTPAGTKEKLPLRTTSAVVTEVSPLYLLLKNSVTFDIKSIYYEEPEMCLHPQLQQVIARVLIQLANANINLTVTTHSDVIIQHVNNMIRLARIQSFELMQRYGYQKEDLIKNLDVSMYQFIENEDGTTTLEELKCGNYGFEVSAFNDALDNILEEIYSLQEEE